MYRLGVVEIRFISYGDKGCGAFNGLGGSLKGLGLGFLVWWCRDVAPSQSLFPSTRNPEP